MFGGSVRIGLPWAVDGRTHFDCGSGLMPPAPPVRDRLRELPEGALRALADALLSRREVRSGLGEAVCRAVGAPPWVAGEVEALIAAGMSPQSLAWGLGLLASDRGMAREKWDGVELTWTGPEEVVTETRDTGAVARQLFSQARSRLWVATYALDGGSKGRALLEVLQERMEQVPELEVRFFVNVSHRHGDLRPGEELLAEFSRWFRREVWTGTRFPSVYHDPRALDPHPGVNACLHAKCIVQDEERTLLTSANLTEAAQERNIEAGVLIADGTFARKVARQFETLMEKGNLLEVKE